MNFFNEYPYGKRQENCSPPRDISKYYAYGGLSRSSLRQDNPGLIVEDNTIYEIDYDCLNCNKKEFRSRNSPPAAGC